MSSEPEYSRNFPPAWEPTRDYFESSENYAAKIELRRVAISLGIGEKVEDKSLEEIKEIIKIEIKRQKQATRNWKIASGILSLILVFVVSGWLISWWKKPEKNNLKVKK